MSAAMQGAVTGYRPEMEKANTLAGGDTSERALQSVERRMRAHGDDLRRLAERLERTAGRILGQGQSTRDSAVAALGEAEPPVRGDMSSLHQCLSASEETAKRIRVACEALETL